MTKIELENEKVKISLLTKSQNSTSCANGPLLTAKFEFLERPSRSVLCDGLCLASACVNKL